MPSQHKFYPCANCHINLIRRKGGICRQCYLAKSLERKLAKVAAKEKERQQRQATKKTQEIKQANRRHKKAQSPCPSVPIMNITFDEDTKREIGKCAHFKGGVCENTGKPCPLNGTIDYDKLREKEYKVSHFARGVDNLGVFPASKQRRRELSNQAKRGKLQDFSPYTLNAYHAPVGHRTLFSSGENSWDDLFKILEQ